MRVLFVTTRCPVPPWRGDQMRAYHHLRLLAPRHTITCCILSWRRPAAEAVAAVAALGVCVEVVPLGWAGMLPALAGAVAGDARPLQVLLFARRRARTRLAALLAEPFDVIHAQLLRALGDLEPGGRALVVDLVDALSANTARRAAVEGGPGAPVLAHEAVRLARAERALIARGGPCLVVSARERAALGDAANVRVVPNGVDGVAFPYRPDGRPPARLVFAGNLGYFPNVDAATWLAHDVLPRVRAAVPAAELRLVGARPARRVRRLVRLPGVSLAASVPDVAPELAASSLAVIPLRAGTGQQNKVLEALATGTPVVATPRATEGLDVRPGEHLLIAEDAAGLAEAAIALLRDPGRAQALARAGRQLVERRYRWEDSAAGVEEAWMAAGQP